MSETQSNPTNPTSTDDPSVEADADAEAGADVDADSEDAEATSQELRATIEGLDPRERIESLPESGKSATVHTVLGRHASKASSLAQERGRTGGIDLNMYLLQQVLTIGGEQLRMEEVRSLPWNDLQVLMQAAGIVEQQEQGGTTPLE